MQFIYQMPKNKKTLRKILVKQRSINAHIVLMHLFGLITLRNMQGSTLEKPLSNARLVAAVFEEKTICKNTYLHITQRSLIKK